MSDKQIAGIVYVYTFPDGKKYVGQTIQKLDSRTGKDGHRYIADGQFVGEGVEEWGWENIEKEYYECETEEEMDTLEQELIALYKTQDSEFGYNRESGGNKHKHLSKETKKKISEAKKGKYAGENAYWYGKHHSEESKKKISEANKGKMPINAKPVICLETKEIFQSTGLAAKAMNLKSLTRIYTACIDHSRTSGGYHWRYLEDYNKENNL